MSTNSSSSFDVNSNTPIGEELLELLRPRAVAAKEKKNMTVSATKNKKNQAIVAKQNKKSAVAAKQKKKAFVAKKNKPEEAAFGDDEGSHLHLLIKTRDPRHINMSAYDCIVGGGLGLSRRRHDEK